MLRGLFLFLIVMSSVAFAQTEEAPKAVKIDEFETATNGYVKMKMDYFYTELNNNPQSGGFIINYGTDREIAIREKQIKVSIQWRKFDATRITFVRGGFMETVKSEFWLVPPGAQNPKPNSTAEKLDEFGTFQDDEVRARLEKFFKTLGNNPKSKGFILIYGPVDDSSKQEARLKKFVVNRKSDSSLITIKKAGFDKKLKTEFWLVPRKDGVKTKIWIVPPGAKPPINK